MSTVARVFSRSSLRTARHVSLRLPPSRILGRRSYSSDHGEIKKTGDTPWILLAVGVTVPGVYLLWHPAPSHGAHVKKHKTHEEPANDSEFNEAQAAEENKSDEGSSDSGSDSAPSPKDPDNSSGEHDESTENQSAKLTDKPASKRVDPIEK